MKIQYPCSASYHLRNLINPILTDNLKLFKKEFYTNKGFIDKKTVFEFCLESNSKKILKEVIKNQKYLNNLVIRNITLKYLIKNNSLKFEEKNKIFKKLFIKQKSFKKLYIFNLAKKYDTNCLKWLQKDFTLNEKQIITLFQNNIDENVINYICKNKMNLNYLLYKFMKIYPYNLENNLHIFTDNQIILFTNYLLLKLNSSEIDFNILDSVIKIIIMKNFLIDRFNIYLLFSIKDKINEKMFDFLNDDIDKIMLFNKLSKNTNISKQKQRKI